VVLPFKVASFDIRYNYIHTAYATMKMPGPKGMITIKADQRNALA
jgi:hypothetical protein